MRAAGSSGLVRKASHPACRADSFDCWKPWPVKAMIGMLRVSGSDLI